MMDAALIVSIVRKGWGSTVLQASVNAGARGGTVLFGRGAGINEQEKIFGMSIEPEKEIVLTITRTDQVDTGAAVALVDGQHHQQPWRGVLGHDGDSLTWSGVRK